jgi:hypothetical protein
MRGNLDGRPRMLEFALAPGICAAYDTQQQSLYQAWDGDVLFEGSIYHYKHGQRHLAKGTLSLPLAQTTPTPTRTE